MRSTIVAAVVAAAVAYVTVGQPTPDPPTPTDPYRYCVESSQPDHRWDCYLVGDVPAGAVIQWAGRQSDIPD